MAVQVMLAANMVDDIQNPTSLAIRQVMFKNAAVKFKEFKACLESMVCQYQAQ
jgi:hypothetical protein